MNLPGLLLEINVPPHLSRNEMPDRFVVTKSLFKKGMLCELKFLDLDTYTVQTVTDWEAFYNVACDIAQEHWDKNNVIPIGTITDNNSVMPGILHSMNTTTISEKVKSN